MQVIELDFLATLYVDILFRAPVAPLSAESQREDATNILDKMVCVALHFRQLIRRWMESEWVAFSIVHQLE